MTARPQNPSANWGVAWLLAILPLSFASSAAEAAKSEPFIAHRAIYELVLDADPSRPMIETGRGRIVFEVTGSECEGFTQNFRQVADLQGEGFGKRLVDSRSTSFEAGDGSLMRFSSTVTVNELEPDIITGEAQKKDDTLRVTLSMPEEQTVDLKGPAEFPTNHYRKIVAAALRGETTLTLRVFDGTTDGKTISETFAAIGKALPADKASDAMRVAGLAAVNHWPVTISYFDGEGPDSETPSYTIAMELYENGVADNLTLNYGDFVLKGTLRQIEILPRRPCP